MDSSVSGNNAEYSQRIQIADFRPRYQLLRKTLEASGVSPEDTNSLMVNKMFATCTQCGIPVSGADLRRIANAGNTVDPDQPKVVRLSQGYCARKSCESHFYNLNFRHVEGVDWNWVWNQSIGLSADVGERLHEEEVGAIRQVTDGFDRRSWTVIGICVVAMSLVVYLQLRTPAYSIRQSGFQIDTNSLFFSIDPNSAAPQAR